MYQNRRDHDSHRAECVGENVQKYTVHVFISMRMIMSVVVTVVVVTMLEAENSNQVYKQTRNADNQELTDPMHLASRRQALHRLVDDLNADDPVWKLAFEICSPSNHSYIRKIPLANPDNVSTLP